MTIAQKVQWLKDNPKITHAVRHRHVGPSHGDPGGYSVIHKDGTCSATVHDGYAIARFDNAKCDCGATAHNLKVDNLIDELLQHSHGST